MSTKVLSVVLVLALICIAGLLAVQFLELSTYSADPSVWSAN